MKSTVKPENTESAEIESEKLKEVNSPVTSENLKKNWMEFAERIKENKPRLANTLNSQIPEMDGPDEIKVAMENANQRDDFNRYLKTDILAYLRKELGNSEITLDITLKEKPNEEKIPYTQEEKYKFLSKKNPNLNLLKNQLGLDLE